MNFTLADRQAIKTLLEQYKDYDLADFTLTDINGKWELLSSEEMRVAKMKCFNRNVTVRMSN